MVRYTILYTTCKPVLKGTLGSSGELKINVIQSVTHDFRPFSDLLRTPSGVPGRSRTCDLPLRRRLLYPTELQGLTGRIV